MHYNKSKKKISESCFSHIIHCNIKKSTLVTLNIGNIKECRKQTVHFVKKQVHLSTQMYLFAVYFAVLHKCSKTFKPCNDNQITQVPSVA